MNIAFLDFWGSFDPNNNFFIYLFRQIKDNVIITDASNADVIIFSCFGDSNKRYNHCKKVFFTGENIRPDFNYCNYSLTFDFDEYGGRNIRLPLWLLYIDWFNVKGYGDPKTLIPLSFINKYIKKEKTKFCASVFSKPISLRFDAINKIQSYKSVDCYGKIHQNHLPDGEDVKLDILSNYKFSICFENSAYPGYFTEKILHAKIAGNIPLYYSDKSFSQDFNENCCLNLINYKNLDHFLDHIKQIDNDDQKYLNILNEPLFKNEINLNDIKDKIQNILF
jgi:hypothetical protein